ncbi:serine hydrolase domain-containing protein [Neomicrococcus aestuarii]|uniref:Hydrolase n=1 Tax=Neomicrococcus aestuarii TaxID=556325 RepID=A0A1L2ZMR3_9MICC|nr:serine hydrolase [Neomicrococcus aestuarii]APF40725.1 hydrolase [Neomicrococcus aestuarii]MBB5512484.1 hypothetical protein [Neomicrococcus aestuarii]
MNQLPVLPSASSSKFGMVPNLQHNGIPQGMDLENWQQDPYLHWTFSHVADFLPTAKISRGDGPVAEVPENLTDFTELAFDSPEYGGPTTVRQVMDDSYTDGWAVMVDGELRTEQYFGSANPETSHILMSVSKSLVGMVVGALVTQGKLDLSKTIESYIPELEGCGYEGATVRHILDMRSGIKFSEEYLDPQAEVRLLEQVIGWAPRRDHSLPKTMYGFLASLKKDGEHGGPFRYRSIETDALGWLCETVSGKKMPELMSELLWSRIGAEHDATIGIDKEGTGMFDGGVNASLLDMVRFGSLFLEHGKSLTGEQVVSAGWIADTFAGGSTSRKAFKQSPDDNRMPGGMYRNQCWFPYEGNEVMLCLGIHGQMIYINRRANMVAAKLSSWPLPQNARMLFPTIQAFDAIAEAVGDSDSIPELPLDFAPLDQYTTSMPVVPVAPAAAPVPQVPVTAVTNQGTVVGVDPTSGATTVDWGQGPTTYGGVSQ